MEVGFLEYYLDEWHANHYPEWIREASGGEADYFRRFILALTEFFRTGKEPVSHRETIAIIAVRETGQKALETPGVWVGV